MFASPKFRVLLAVVGVVLVGLVGLQLVPGYERTNPPVARQIQWNSLETEQLARQACYDCHSNETVWPWYSNVAPISWLVVKDVNEGRRKMNFSSARGELEGDEMIENIQRGKMPPSIYLMMHPEANLNATQKADLIAGIQATFGG